MTGRRPIDDEMLARLSDYLDGTLAPQEREALESRLADDADLAAELACLRRVDDLVRDNAPAMPGVDWGQFTRDARARRAAESTAPRSMTLRRYLRPMAAAAAMTLIVSGAAWWQATRDQDPAGRGIEVSVERVALISSSMSVSVSRELPVDAIATSGPAPRGRTLIVTVTAEEEDDTRRDSWEEDAALF